MVVYESINRFCQINDVSATALEKIINNNTLMGGYYWIKAPNYDYPPTVLNEEFVDPLDLKIPLLKKQISKKKITKIKIIRPKKQKAQPVLQYDLEGTLIKEWAKAKDAATHYSIDSSMIRMRCRDGKEYKNSIWEYKKII
jgi:hypothetical protein